MCFLLIVFTEGIIRLSNLTDPKGKRNIKKVYAKGYTQRDSTGSVRPRGKGMYKSKKYWKEDNQVIYDVTYTIDEHKRRSTPIQDISKTDKFAVFFGGSFTFGEGVEDNQTLPYYFGVFSQHYHPYNYGFHGHGPAEMLAKLETGDLPKEVSEKRGVLIYSFIDNHVHRTIGSMYFVTDWGWHKPYYHLTSNDEIVRKGSFLTGRPFLTRLYRLLGKSKTLRYFQIDFPLQIGREQLWLVYRVIEESRTLFLRQFPNSQFYVLIWPRTNANYDKQLKSFLESKNIPFFYQPDLYPRDNDKFTIAPPVDWHPTPLAYETVAQSLAHDLKVLDRQ